MGVSMEISKSGSLKPNQARKRNKWILLGAMAVVTAMLSACAKKEPVDTKQKQEQEQTKVEQAAYQPPAQWTEIDKATFGKRTITIYMRATEHDDTIKGVKVETAARAEDDFRKTPLTKINGYAIVNCEKQLVQLDDGSTPTILDTQNYLKFACGNTVASHGKTLQGGLQSVNEISTSKKSGNALSRGDWTHIISFPNGNGKTINHVFVDEKTKTGNSSLVRTTLESGNLDGWSLIYRKEADCASNTMRTVSTVSWYNPKGSYAKETQPNNPGWQTVKNDGDVALIGYLCQ